MTRQFDENFKSILSSVKDKFIRIPNTIKKSPMAWAAIIMFIIGTSTGSFKTKIYNELNNKGGDVSKDEVVEVIRNLYVSNNQTVPADVEERIKSVTKPSTPAVKTKAGPFVMLPPSSTTECNWPIVPRIARVESDDQRMYNYLVSTGKFTPMLAAAIIGNIYVESKFDPTTKQIARYNKGGPPKYGPGRGLIQWEKGGRFDTDRINLVSFAKKQGKKWTDFNTQIDFIIHELTVHPEYMRVKQMLNNADSVEDATLIFLKKYEKAGVPHTGKRLRYAKELEQTMDQ